MRKYGVVREMRSNNTTFHYSHATVRIVKAGEYFFGATPKTAPKKSSSLP